MKALSIRARLTLWNGAVLSVFVAVFAVVAYAVLRETAVAQVDRNLHQQQETIVHAARSALASHPDDTTAAMLVALNSSSERIATFMLGERGLFLGMAHTERSDGDDRGRERRTPGAGDSAEIATEAARHTVLPATFTLRLSGHDARVRVAPLRLPSGHYSLVSTESLGELDELLERIRAVALAVLPALLVLAAGGGYVTARRGLAPVAAMSEQAATISAANLHERLVQSDSDDELGELARAFNSLLERVDRAFTNQRRFMADASHELRTPVAIIRGEADVALSIENREPDDYREALRIIRGGSQRLSHTVDDLFFLTRADAGQAPLRVVPFYLDELITDCARSVRSLAQAAVLEVGIPPECELPYCGDEQLLTRAILNLLDNALKYSAAKGTIRLELRAKDDRHVITVADEGPGIPPSAQPFVFDRFFRADESRSRAGPLAQSGTGLGLSIARWIAEVHGGRLELVSSSPAGTMFELTLPRTPLLLGL